MAAKNAKNTGSRSNETTGSPEGAAKNSGSGKNKDAASPKELDWWRQGEPRREYSLEVIAICDTDAIGDFNAKQIELVAKVNTRLPRKNVTIKLSLGDNPEFETMTELVGRLKKDRQFALLLEFAELNNKGDRERKWHFGHALVDNVKLKIETMNGDAKS